MNAPRKQRHTAKRIFCRLQNEAGNFNASYRLAAGYVAVRKKELNLNRGPGCIPLKHFPGEAQADFGYADFYEDGVLHHEAKYLVLSFPYSNAGYLQLNYGENLECLMEGLKAIFEYIGGVPKEIWFDNTRTIVTKIHRNGKRDLTERFGRFTEHYGFKAVFMNPASGNEKGNVENKVGYLRRNVLVPAPHFKDLSAENRSLLERCTRDMVRKHYDKGMPINELFEEDKKALRPLPRTEFDTAHYMTANADGYGKFTLDSGRHRYSTSPAYSNKQVNLKLTSGEVIVIDDDMHEVIRHKRLYGKEKAESMDWIPYLEYIARRPRSIKNSGIYGMMPEVMQKYMDMCQTTEIGKILKVLAELTKRTCFDDAGSTVKAAIEHHAVDHDNLKALHALLFPQDPYMPPLEKKANRPEVPLFTGNTDLYYMDRALRKRV